MGEWQPIETAPHDGRQVWVFDDSLDPNQFVACWSFTNQLKKGHPDYWEGWLFADELLCNHADCEVQPTHWQPLVPPAETIG